MKVLHYIPSLAASAGGVASYLSVLCEELGKLVELHVATSYESKREVKICNAIVHRISSGLTCYSSSKALLKELRPDVVHINGCWQPQLAFFQWAARSLKIPVVLSPHGMLEPWIVKRHHWTRKWPAIQLYQRGLVKHADYLHATADKEKENLLRLGWNARIAVIPNAVNIQELPLKDNWRTKRRIVFMSRLHVKKGIELLLEALSHLKPDLDGYEVIIAGEGEPDYVETLKKAAISLGLSEVVIFVGGVYGAEKVSLLQSADFFCSTNLQRELWNCSRRGIGLWYSGYHYTWHTLERVGRLCVWLVCPGWIGGIRETPSKKQFQPQKKISK